MKTLARALTLPRTLNLFRLLTTRFKILSRPRLIVFAPPHPAQVFTNPQPISRTLVQELILHPLNSRVTQSQRTKREQCTVQKLIKSCQLFLSQFPLVSPVRKWPPMPTLVLNPWELELRTLVSDLTKLAPHCTTLKQMLTKKFLLRITSTQASKNAHSGILLIEPRTNMFLVTFPALASMTLQHPLIKSNSTPQAIIPSS